MKVLFLDIDGVLNCMCPTPMQDNDWIDLDEWRYGFNPDLVARLRYVIGNTDCKIVFSSSWRHHKTYAPYQPDMNWRDVLANKLRRERDEIFVGETPTDPKGIRGLEINKWLSEHPEVESFCVVDDEVVDILPYIDNSKVVKTDMTVGLNKDGADSIIKVLNSGKP